MSSWPAPICFQARLRDMAGLYLQLYTRRLNEWARAGGGAGYWSGVLGQQVLGAKSSALDFVRTELFAEPAF